MKHVQNDLRLFDIPGMSRITGWSYAGESVGRATLCSSSDQSAITVDDWRTWRKHVVRIDRTLCGWGGSRPWFLCPECG